jgi:sec-independent protein translocase protein TatA
MFGSGEILVILVVILILFGGKKLPEFAQSLGKGIREFKKACQGEEELTVERIKPETKQPSVPNDPSNQDPS